MKDIDFVKPTKPPQPTETPALPTAPVEPPRLSDNDEKPKSHKKWWIIGIVAGFIVLLAAAVSTGFWWYSDAIQPKSNAGDRQRIVVTEGETAQTIGTELQEKGVIKSALAFQWYIQLHGQLGQLKAGIYYFSANQSIQEIVQWLIEGRVDAFYITILPGKTLTDIKKTLVENEFAVSEVDAAFAKPYDHPLLKDKPAELSLEGYIFPETYEITSDTTAEQLLVRTFDEFYQRIQDNNLVAALQSRGFNLHQAITLASLIELEVSGEQDRRQVAQVFEKRLQEDMPLGSDVTFLYAAKLLNQEPSINIDSPYNTRRYAGLPPGPIANVTMQSLQAVANPAPGDYLYFVSGDDGTNHFSRTFEEHEENIRKYCTELCAAE